MPGRTDDEGAPARYHPAVPALPVAAQGADVSVPAHVQRVRTRGDRAVRAAVRDVARGSPDPPLPSVPRGRLGSRARAQWWGRPMTQERESEQRIWIAVALSVAVYFLWTTIF